jgi:protein-S-isoprenylcysteine O-methyltransferase Ste14
MRKLRALVPLLLTVIGFLAFGVLWSRRTIQLGPTSAGFFCGLAFLTYVVWVARESRVSARETKLDEIDRDHGTLELAALAKYGLLIAALVPESKPTAWLGALGLALLGGGAMLRIRAVRVMGTAYTHRIRPPSGRIVTEGPYALVRHPAYLGTLLAHAGVVLVLPNLWSAAALALLWVPAVVVRVVVEDRFLRSFPDYAAYANRVRFGLVPGVL